MTDLRIGLASVCTTPEEPIWMHGYAGKIRQQPFGGKLHDLHAKAMAFEDAAGSQSVLITVDLCVLRKTEADRVAARIAERTGLSSDCVIVNLSHTHSGPMIGVVSDQRYPVPQDVLERIGVYTDRLVERLAEAAAAALANLRPAQLSWGRGRVGFVRNRRRFDDEGHYCGMGPNPDGFTDPRVTALRVDDPDGAPRALAFSLACHAVTFGPKNLKLSGDYPGFAQEMLEARQPGLQAMFIQGCGADANPEPRSVPDQLDWAQRQGQELADETERVADRDLEPIRGPLRTAHEWLDLPLRSMSRQELEAKAAGPEYAAHNAKRLLEQLDRGETPATTYRTPVVVWQFGEDLTLVALPGETVSGYIQLIEEALGPERLWVAGYSNEVFGYLPTASIVAEGGYEARGLVREVGVFAAEAEDVTVDAVRRLAREIGR
ncbi:MAG: neutral/alkaline non-lysosomal ceramidase N-terminal domain-containing protein [Planctomycetota bacterium]|jgi:hypothetical protein|nr:neutral/alkaline non-lysosomal ceramidase N-terminal domain-containing protein [Planctomycetota bacterium]